MKTIKFNVGMASAFFVTDAKRNLVLFNNPYLVFLSAPLTISLLAEILTRVYNLAHRKGFLGVLLKNAEKEPIEKLLDDLIHERKLSPTVMGSPHPILIFGNGIEKQCLLSMKMLKLRGLVFIAAVNIQNDYEAVMAPVKTAEEIRTAKRDEGAMATICRPAKLQVVIGKEKTALITDGNFDKLIRENPDMITSACAMPITDKRQIVDEGLYD